MMGEFRENAPVCSLLPPPQKKETIIKCPNPCDIPFNFMKGKTGICCQQIIALPTF